MATWIPPPNLLAGRWVVATVDGERQDEVDIHVSVALESLDERPHAEELDVQLVAGDRPLKQIAGPDVDEPLPVVTTRSATAFGQYSFSRPEGVHPTEIHVSFRGESAVFEVLNLEPT